AFAVLALSIVRWEMMVSAIVFGVGFGLAYPAFATFILGNTDPTRRARTFGSIVWAFDTGIGLGSLGVGAIGERYGLAEAFAFAGFAAPDDGGSGTSLAGEVRHVTPAE